MSDELLDGSTLTAEEKLCLHGPMNLLFVEHIFEAIRKYGRVLIVQGDDCRPYVSDLTGELAFRGGRETLGMGGSARLDATD